MFSTAQTKHEATKQKPKHERMVDNDKQTAQRLVTHIETTKEIQDVTKAILRGTQSYIEDYHDPIFGTIYWLFGTRQRVAEAEALLATINSNSREVILFCVADRLKMKTGGWEPTSLNTNLLYELLGTVKFYFDTDPNPRETVPVDHLKTIAENFVMLVEDKRRKAELKEQERAIAAAKPLSRAAQESDAAIKESMQPTEAEKTRIHRMNELQGLIAKSQLREEEKIGFKNALNALLAPKVKAAEQSEEEEVAAVVVAESEASPAIPAKNTPSVSLAGTDEISPDHSDSESASSEKDSSSVAPPPPPPTRPKEMHIRDIEKLANLSFLKSKKSAKEKAEAEKSKLTISHRPKK